MGDEREDREEIPASLVSREREYYKNRGQNILDELIYKSFRWVSVDHPFS